MLTSPRPQHVLITTSTFPMAPDDAVSARFVLDLAQHLTAHCRVTVLAPAGPHTQAREPWGDVTVRRFRYAVPAGWQTLASGEGMMARMRASWGARLQAPGFVAAQWAMLPRLLEETGADLINPHWIVPQGVVAAGWARARRVPMVVTSHGADVAWLDRSAVGRHVAKRVFDACDGFIAVSTALADRTARILGRPLDAAAIPMGVAVDRFLPTGAVPAVLHDDSRPVVLFVGKFVPKKGIPVLLDAMDVLRRQGLSARVLLVGGGPGEPALRAQVARLGLGDAVTFVGWVKNDELPAYYRAARVVCLPSVQDAFGETEGTPVVLQEALACGAMVVGSRSSGVGEVIRDGENGWSVEPGDAPALARALQRALAADAPLRAAVQAAARETAEAFTWPRVAARFYERFIAAAAAHARRNAAR